MDQQGKLRFRKWYEKLYAVNNKFFRIQDNGLSGFITSYGENILAKGYQSLTLCSKHSYEGLIVYALGDENGKKYLIFFTDDGFTLSAISVDEVFNYNKSHTYYPVKIENKTNLILSDGTLLLPESYDEILICNNNRNIIVVREGERYNLFSNKNRRFLSETWFDSILKDKDNGLFYNDICGIKIEGKFNFIDKDGNIMCREYFDGIYDFQNGFAGVENNDRKNYVDKHGELISDIWFDSISPFNRHLKAVVSTGKDSEGNDLLNILDDKGTLLLDLPGTIIKGIDINESEYAVVSYLENDNEVTKYYHYCTNKTYDSISDLNNYEDIQSDTGELKEQTDTTSNDKLEEERKDRVQFAYAYDSFISSNKYRQVVFNDMVNYVDKESKLLFDTWIKDNCNVFRHGVIIVNSNHNGWSVINPSENALSMSELNNQFDNVRSTPYKYIFIVTKDGKDALCYSDGITSCLKTEWYDKIEDFNNFIYTKVYNEGQFNFIKANGEIESHLWSNEVNKHGEGLWPIHFNSMFNIINQDGELILKDFCPTLARSCSKKEYFTREKGYGASFFRLINTDGSTTRVTGEVSDIKELTESELFCSSKIIHKGITLISTLFTQRIETADRIVLIDEIDGITIPKIKRIDTDLPLGNHGELFTIQDKMALLTDNDYSNEIISQMQSANLAYDKDKRRSDNYACTSIMKEDIEDNKDEPKYLVYNFAIVYKGGKVFLLNLLRGELIPESFDEIILSKEKDHIIKVRRGDSWNILDIYGDILSSDNWYDNITPLEKGSYLVKKDGLYNILKPNGKVIGTKWFENKEECKTKYNYL